MKEQTRLIGGLWRKNRLWPRQSGLNIFKTIFADFQRRQPALPQE
jgi:hypothetical protein